MSRETISLDLMNEANDRARTLVREKLGAYNHEHSGISDECVLDVILRNEHGDPIGGLVGRTSLGVLFVDTFYIPNFIRRIGYGSRMLSMAETEAVRRGCSRAVLFTMEIHAPAFYERNGYQSFGRIECEPPGNARIFMKKELV